MPLTVLFDALKRVVEDRQTLSREEARAVLDAVLLSPEQNGFPDHDLQLAALLGAMAARGETTEELAGLVDALRTHATPLPLTDAERDSLVDTCGTGGDGSGTFNISTAAALVAVSAGARVAKHGNRAVTSQAGSADVLEALGIPVDLSPAQAAEALRTHGFAFLAAPAYHPALRRVMPVRRALGIRTAFNLLGPLANPAGARAQVIGVYSARVVPIVAETIALLGTRQAFVVHGSGMDEFSIAGPTLVGQVLDTEAQFGNLLPENFGLPLSPMEALRGGNAQENASILRSIFAGERGPRRDVVVMNAAAVLITAELAGDFLEGVRLAEDAIDACRTTRLIDTLTSN